MRNKIIVGIALVVVFVLGALSVRAWDRYEVQARIKTEYSQYQERQAVEQAQRAEAKRQSVETAEKARLKQECEEGQKAFLKLPLAEQAKASKPVCDLQQVE